MCVIAMQQGSGEETFSQQGRIFPPQESTSSSFGLLLLLFLLSSFLLGTPKRGGGIGVCTASTSQVDAGPAGFGDSTPLQEQAECFHSRSLHVTKASRCCTCLLSSLLLLITQAASAAGLWKSVMVHYSQQVLFTCSCTSSTAKLCCNPLLFSKYFTCSLMSC